jgi:hypothetical protein
VDFSPPFCGLLRIAIAFDPIFGGNQEVFGVYWGGTLDGTTL